MDNALEDDPLDKMSSKQREIRVLLVVDEVVWNVGSKAGLGGNPPETDVELV